MPWGGVMVASRVPADSCSLAHPCLGKERAQQDQRQQRMQSGTRQKQAGFAVGQGASALFSLLCWPPPPPPLPPPEPLPYPTPQPPPYHMHTNRQTNPLTRSLCEYSTAKMAHRTSSRRARIEAALGWE